MDFVVKILGQLGIAKPKRSIYSQYEGSVTNLDREVNDVKRKLTAANDAIKFLNEDNLEKAVEVALKGFKLGAVNDQMKKLEQAKEKGDMSSVLKAIPRKSLFSSISRAAGDVASDVPSLITKSAKVVEEGAEMVTERIPNSGASGLELMVTAASAKKVVEKSKTLKQNVEDLKGQADTLKKNVDEMLAKSEAMPDE